VTVGIDLTEVDEERFRELELLSLQRKLAIRLTQSGFAVVDPKRGPRITLVFSTEGARTVVVRVKSRSPNDVVHHTSAVSAGSGSVLAYHLELIHKAVELARQVAESRPASRPTSRPTPPASQPTPPASQPAPPPPPPPRHPRPRPIELALGPVALYRIHGTDPLLRLGGRFGVVHSLGLRLSATVSPSFDDDLSALEWSLQGGASWRWGLSSTLHLEGGLLLGFLHHTYSMRNDAFDPASGSQWDFVATLMLELGWRLSRRLGLRAWLAPGLTEQSRIHQTGPVVVWERSLFRLEGGLLAVLHLR